MFTLGWCRGILIPKWHIYSYIVESTPRDCIGNCSGNFSAYKLSVFCSADASRDSYFPLLFINYQESSSTEEAAEESFNYS